VNQNESFTQEIPMPLTSHSEFQSDDMHKSSVCYKTRTIWHACSVWFGRGRKHYSEQLRDSICHHDFLFFSKC